MPGSFAATSLVIVMSERRKLAVLPLDGVMPTMETIRDGRYKYIRPLLLVTHGVPNPTALRFMAFIRSRPGAEVLRNTGVELSPAAL